MVEGRDHRGLALQRRHGLRRDRPPPARRPLGDHPPNQGRRSDLDVDLPGIPTGSFVNVVREDPVRPGLLYAGTETGVFVSFDDGEHWQSLQLNLPNCSISDIDVRHGDLVVAHARSRVLGLGRRFAPTAVRCDRIGGRARALRAAPGLRGSPGALPGEPRAQGRADGGEPAERRDPRLLREVRHGVAAGPRDPG